jgi:hypothetical protein
MKFRVPEGHALVSQQVSAPRRVGAAIVAPALVFTVYRLGWSFCPFVELACCRREFAHSQRVGPAAWALVQAALLLHTGRASLSTFTPLRRAEAPPRARGLSESHAPASLLLKRLFVSLFLILE